MKMIECMHTQCNCYGVGRASMKPIGIVVHSTGANNPYLKRYVQPSQDDPKREELLAVLGKNTYGNSWNRANVYKSAHYFVGKCADGSVAVAQILPEEIAAWGVGKGNKGSYNYDPTGHIQFEVCEDALTDKSYFAACYNAATELCADICYRYGWEAEVIVSHKEAYDKGYASNHGDIDHWLKKFGLSMDDFRTEVKKRLAATAPEAPDASNAPGAPDTPDAPDAPTATEVPKREPKVGDLVDFKERTHYSNANKLLPALCRPGRARITKIYGVGKCRHPYHLIAVKGGGSSVCGWVNEGSFTLVADKGEPEASENVPTEPQKEIPSEGDRVKVKAGATNYTGKGLAPFVYERIHEIKEITGDRAVITYNGEIAAAMNVKDLYKV